MMILIKKQQKTSDDCVISMEKLGIFVGIFQYNQDGTEESIDDAADDDMIRTRI